MEKPLEPGLYVVATPIGNLGDLSARAADVLCQAALVLAEDTRITRRLLAHAGSKAPMRRYDDHSGEVARRRIVEELAGSAIALVSDAGTPLVSDPGYKLVRMAREAGRFVTTVPGPCAAIAALSIAGLPTDRFLFLGFLPAKARARTGSIAEIADVRATLIFYESGPRLGETLLALAQGLGEREAVVAREITKLHEECVTGTLGVLAKLYSDNVPKGEMVIVVAPPPEAEAASDADLDAHLRAAMERLSPSRAAAEVAELLNIPKKRAYARAQEIKEDGR